jgi:hypothetical protein
VSADVKVLLKGWAERARSGRVGPKGYPSQSWSEAAMARTGGEDDGWRTASGNETRSFKPLNEPESFGLDDKIEAGVARLSRVQPILWAVGTAYYLGQVPIGFRAAHKQRRRRFGRDDTTGILRVNRERLPRLNEDTEATWKARISRRLTMTPRRFDEHLVRFHDSMIFWLADDLKR